MIPIPLEIVPRHIHLCTKDRRTLFGDAAWKKHAPLKHRGQFFSGEHVQVKGPSGQTLLVPVFGPERERTQLELSAVEAAALGIKAPVRFSGDKKRGGAVALEGPEGKIKKIACAMLPVRHIHVSAAQAKQQGWHHMDSVSLTTVSAPARIIPHVMIRVHPTFRSAFHLTMDEAILYGVQAGENFYVS